MAKNWSYNVRFHELRFTVETICYQARESFYEEFPSCGESLGWIRTTRKTGGLSSPVRACYLLASCLFQQFELPCILTCSLLLKELFLLRPERICIFLARSLIEHDIFSILLPYIFPDDPFVHSCCADILSHSPESLVAIPVFQLGTFILYYLITDDIT